MVTEPSEADGSITFLSSGESTDTSAAGTGFCSGDDAPDERGPRVAWALLKASLIDGMEGPAETEADEEADDEEDTETEAEEDPETGAEAGAEGRGAAAATDGASTRAGSVVTAGLDG